MILNIGLINHRSDIQYILCIAKPKPFNTGDRCSFPVSVYIGVGVFASQDKFIFQQWFSVGFGRHRQTLSCCVLSRSQNWRSVIYFGGLVGMSSGLPQSSLCEPAMVGNATKIRYKKSNHLCPVVPLTTFKVSQSFRQIHHWKLHILQSSFAQKSFTWTRSEMNAWKCI